MQIKMVSIETVKPYPGNPRKANDAVAKVRASLQEYGWQQPIVVDNEFVIIAGHTRYQAARELEMDKVPVHIARGLSEAQVRAYRIADNRTGSEAAWDEELLRTEMADLVTLGANMDALGFDAVELEALLADEPPPASSGGREPGIGNAIISYQLIFGSEAEQTVWFDFLRYLKRKMPDEETIGARVTRFLTEGGHGAHP